MPGMSLLASPLLLPSGASLENRLAKSAMSETLADLETNAPTDGLIRVYERWARSGAGLLITGHVIVDPEGLGEPGNVVIVDDSPCALASGSASRATKPRNAATVCGPGYRPNVSAAHSRTTSDGS